MSLNPLTYQPTATSSKGPPCLQLLEFSCDSSCSFAIGQFPWTSSDKHLLCWNVWQKPKYKFCVINNRNQNTNFVWSCWSHTFPHCWDGISNGSTFVSPHCWTNNVRQFTPAEENRLHHAVGFLHRSSLQDSRFYLLKLKLYN